MSKDKKLEEAASSYVESQGYVIGHENDNCLVEYIIRIESEIKDGFIAGATYVKESSQKRIEELEKKLEITVSALEKCKEIRRKDGNDNEYKGPEAIISEDALKKIKGEDA